MDAPRRAATRKAWQRFSIVYLVVGAYIAAHIVRTTYLNLRSHAVPARVIAVSVEQHTSRRGKKLFWPSVRFVYRQGGVEREATRYRVEPGPATDRAAAEARANEYYVGEEVTAYAVPGDSTIAFLRRERPVSAAEGLAVLICVWLLLRCTAFSDRRINGTPLP